MDLDLFIEENNIQPGDAIVVRKDFIALLDHYLIYLGKAFNKPHFMANYTRGTKILDDAEIEHFTNFLAPVRIRKFIGSNEDRKSAIKRALLRRDRNSYSLILNNCEHFANYVQTGSAYSKQTRIFGTGLVVAGLATAYAGKDNEAARTSGLVVAGIGLITLLLENNK